MPAETKTYRLKTAVDGESLLEVRRSGLSLAAGETIELDEAQALLNADVLEEVA